MSAELKNVYAPGPAVDRGKPVHFGAHPKGTHFIYASSRSIVIRNVSDPLDSDVYSEHTADCTVAKYAPSGFYIASGDATGKIRIWDTINKEHILKIELPVLAAPVTDLAWTEDSKRIVAVGDGREVFGRAFMFDSGSTVGEISGHSKQINSCDVKPNRPYRAATGGLDNLVNFFPGPPFKFDHSNKDHTRFVNCVRYAPDGSKFVSVGSDKRIYAYDGKTGEQIAVFANEKEGGHTAGIYSASWSADSSKLLTASADQTARIYDAATGKCETVFRFAEKPATEFQQLGCLWVGDALLSMSLGGVISFLDTANPNTPARRIFGHNKTVTALAFDAADNAFYSGCAAGLTLRWDAATAHNERVGGAGHSNQVQRIAIDGDTVYSAAMDDTVRVEARGAGGAYSASIATEGLPFDLAAAAGTVVVATNKAVQLIRNGAVVHTLAGTHEATAVAIAPNAAEVAVGGSDNVVRIYKVAGDKLDAVRELAGHRGAVTALAYSPDGSKLASVCKMRLVKVWNSADGAAIVNDEWCHHSAVPLALAFSPDGSRIVTGALDSNAIVWNLNDLTKRIEIKRAHPLGVCAVAFVDNDTIITGGHDATVRTWTLA